MADSFGSVGAAGAGGGAGFSGLGGRGGGLGNILRSAFGSPAMNDWYQQYAAERQGRRNKQIGFTDGPNLPMYSDSYKSPGDMRYMGSDGAKGLQGLRNAPPQQAQQDTQYWTYKENPYTPEYIQYMKDIGQFNPSPGHMGTFSDGNRTWQEWVPESKNDMFGSFSPYSPVPGYLGHMNALVAAMNHVNNGGTHKYYTDMIDRYKSDPNLLMSDVNQVDAMLNQAYELQKVDPNSQWAKTIITTYEPQRDAYKQMVQQFDTAFRQWQPNPGYGTSWEQTETPWQGMAQYLEQAQYGTQPTGGSALRRAKGLHGIGQAPQGTVSTMPVTQYQAPQGTVSTMPVTQYQAPQGTKSFMPVTQNYAAPYQGPPAGYKSVLPDPSYRSWRRR